MEIKIELNHKEKKQKNLEQYFLWLLARKDYFTSQLRKKGVEKGYSPLEIAQAIARLQEKNLLNDQLLLIRFVKAYQARGVSKRAIMAKLLQLGQDRVLIEEALEDKEDAPSLEKILSKFRLEELTEKERTKLIGKLCRKGFSLTDILERIRGD